MPQSFVFRLRVGVPWDFSKILGSNEEQFYSPLNFNKCPSCTLQIFYYEGNAFAPRFVMHPNPFSRWWISHCYNIQRMRVWLTFDMCLFRAWQQLFCQCNTRKLQKWQYNLMYSMKFEARHIRFALLHIGWQRAFVTRDVLNLACSYSARWQRAISNRTTGKCAPMMSFLGKI